MLCRENFGGREERGLRAIRDGGQHRRGRHDGLARTNVPLQEPTHRLRALDIGENLLQDALLCLCQLERK